MITGFYLKLYHHIPLNIYTYPSERETGCRDLKYTIPKPSILALSSLYHFLWGKNHLKNHVFQLPPLRGQPRDLSPHCLTALQRRTHPQLAGLSPPTQAQRVQNSSPSSFPDLQTPLTSLCPRLLPRSNPPVSPPESRSLHPHGLCPCLANVHQVTKSHQIRPLPTPSHQSGEALLSHRITPKACGLIPHTSAQLKGIGITCRACEATLLGPIP